MATEPLGVHNWIRCYDALNTRAVEKRGELVKIEKDQSRKLASLLPILRDMHEHLKNKPVCKETEEYPTIEEWIDGWVKPFLHLEKRQVFAYIGVGTYLLGKVEAEKIEAMGIEKAKVLAEVVKSKGKVSPAMVDRAISGDLAELKEEKRVLLYGHGGDEHADGKWETMEIRGPKEYLGDIRKFLKLSRRQEGNKPSDAELISLPLHNYTTGLEANQQQEEKKAAGLPWYKVFVCFRAFDGRREEWEVVAKDIEDVALDLAKRIRKWAETWLDKNKSTAGVEAGHIE